MIDYVLLNNVNRSPSKDYIFRKNFEKPEKAVYREFSIMSLFSVGNSSSYIVLPAYFSCLLDFGGSAVPMKIVPLPSCFTV
jgi:hypothetical protein